MRYGKKSHPCRKLLVRALRDGSYLERGMGGRKATTGGELCVFRQIFSFKPHPYMINQKFSTFKNYLKEAAINRGLILDSINPFFRFMCSWLFEKYGIKKDAKIIDVGAGPGMFLITVYDAGYKNISAVDRDDYFFDSFKSRFGFNCYKQDMDFEPLPFENESVDVIFNSFVIAHLKSPDNFLSESYRVLKPNGIIFTITPDWQKQYKTFWRDPTHIHPYDKTGLARLLLMYGFKPEIYSWGCAFGLGRIEAYKWAPQLGLIGGNILAVGHKDKLS